MENVPLEIVRNIVFFVCENPKDFCKVYVDKQNIRQSLCGPDVVKIFVINFYNILPMVSSACIETARCAFGFRLQFVFMTIT